MSSKSKDAPKFAALSTRPDPTSVKNAPAAAFRLAALSAVRFTEPETEAAAGASVPFSMVARTGKPINHYYWGRIVHDFEGMKHRDAIPVDYHHEVREPIGYADSFDTSSGDLVVAGSVESLEHGDEADKLIKRSARKIPYQASIYFDHENLVLEWLDAGMSAEVNGETVHGPLVIAREWTLRGVAICTHGYDIGSETELDAAASFSLSWKGTAMSTSSTPTDAGQLTAGATTPTTPATAPASAPATVPPVDHRAAFTAELKRFTERFGDAAGAGYFSAGMSFEQAAEKHLEVMAGQLTAAKAEAADAAEKLKAAQLKHGEAEGVATGGASTKSQSFETLFKAK